MPRTSPKSPFDADTTVSESNGDSRTSGVNTSFAGTDAELLAVLKEHGFFESAKTEQPDTKTLVRQRKPKADTERRKLRRKQWQLNKQRRNRVKAAISSGHPPPTNLDEMIFLEDLRRQKFAFWLISCYDNLLEDNSYSHEELGKRTVLEEALEQRLVGEFRAARAKLNQSPEEALAFHARIRNRAVEHPSEPKGTDSSRPKVVPALYKDRPNKAQSAYAFLVEHYKMWLGTDQKPAEIYRSQIRNWDKGLYQALYAKRNDIPNFDTLLPPSKGRSSWSLGKSDSELLRERRYGEKVRYSKHIDKNQP